MLSTSASISYCVVTFDFKCTVFFSSEVKELHPLIIEYDYRVIECSIGTVEYIVETVEYGM